MVKLILMKWFMMCLHIWIYTTCSLVFEFSIWYNLDELFFFFFKTISNLLKNIDPDFMGHEAGYDITISAGVTVYLASLDSLPPRGNLSRGQDKLGHRFTGAP